MDFKGLSNFSNEKYLAGDQGVIVYLESTDDEFIFKKWFGNSLSKIEFKAVSGERANGGCRVIIQKIHNLPQNEQVPCFGVVDRDALLNPTQNNETLWWEVDDEKFFAAKPFGEKIFVLGRWELENYLLHPEAIHYRLENSTLGASGYDKPVDLAEAIVQHEDNLVAISTLATLGRGDRSVRYGQGESGTTLWQKVADDTNASDTLIQKHKENIIQFSENKTDPLERWDRLSRMLDGKRVMFRIDNITGQKVCLEKERGNLTDDISNLGLIDKDLKLWIEQLV